MRIVPATPAETPVILDMIKGLAEYEKLSHIVTATEEQIRQTLFGPKPAAEVLLAEWNSEWAGFALFFPTYSTFLAQPGLYLEDLYVKPHARGKGLGLALLKELNARIVAGAEISPDDLMIQLSEFPGENFSFGQGLAQRAFVSQGTREA